MEIHLKSNEKCYKDKGLKNWGATELVNLKKGDRFRIYTAEGEPLMHHGREVFIVAVEPSKHQDEWIIEVE